MKISKMESPGSFTAESVNKDFSGNCDDNKSWNGFHNGLVSGLWPQKQWLVFPATPSSMSRVDKWVRDLEIRIAQPSDNVNGEEGITFPHPHNDKSPARNNAHSPCRSDIDLSETQICPCFYRPYHSRITAKEPSHTQLVKKQDQHHRRTSRTVRAVRLSNCTLIKELYLVGNKISDLKSLHRLLKLTVLDVSFNKITTTKALGQLVSNYNSQQAMNLLGNHIHSNVSDDQLRRTISSLLPKLTYLNKQTIKPHRGREMVTDNIPRAALGSGSWSSPRKTTNKGSHGGSTSPSMHESSNKNKSKSRNRHHLSSMSPAHASSSR
ncbi:hypothetical protein V6N11_028876 [Hibiscus sabdariffa]|uniref:Uncharacterized protein n=1 Tax=Hibiscus sabdariffa TaxID=183260 RepID=A0ABR1ZV18_9ROSI